MDQNLVAEPTPESKAGNSDADIYGDLPDFRYDVTLDQLKASVAKLEAKNHVLQSKLVKVSEEKKSLDVNYSALFKTAKLEIQRKERTILELREQLNLLRRKQPGLKRSREMTATPSPRKRPKLNSEATPSPRKRPKLYSERVRAEKHPPRVQSRIRSSKPNVLDRDEKSNHFRKFRRGHEVSEKENAPMKRPTDEKGQLANGNHAAPCVTGDPRPQKPPETAAPSLPAIACPTLFSDRMYKRIYGSSPEKGHRKLSISTDKIQPAGVNKQPESSDPERKRRAPPNIGSFNQRPSSYLCRRVTPEDIRAYLGVEDPSDSDSSSGSSEHLSPCQRKPFATSYVKPQTPTDPTSSKVSLAGLQPEPPIKKFEVCVRQSPAVEPLSAPSAPSNINDISTKINAETSSNVARAELHKPAEPIHLPPTVELPSVHTVPAEESKDFSPKINAETSSNVARAELHKPVEPIHLPPTVELPSVHKVPAEETKDFPPKISADRSNSKSRANGNLLPVRKPRQQTIDTIRPIQKLAAQETLAVPDKLDKRSVVTPGPNASTENLPESKPTEINSSVGSAEKPNRQSKIPGLPGSAKGRMIRQVFAPISNQWNCSLPTAPDLKDSSRKGCSELSVVQTVSVTSELTVRVEDSKLDGLRRHSLTEAVFGSPVKWADDSLDSPTAEGSANSPKTTFYSIFGSPLKSVDSNSSEHPFSVPPGAYEESCWTNQIPEKMQKSSLADSHLQKHGQRSQEPSTETNSKEKSPGPNAAETVATVNPLCPPPSSSVIKKHVSIFSPMKDSKISSNVPDDLSRSNTGIFFPFPKPKYEDSILGQFDDTAQFVSAVASNFRVNSEISPLSTPVKSGDHLKSVIVKSNPTSFEEVFNKNVPETSEEPNSEPSTLRNGTDGTFITGNPKSAMQPKGLSDEKDAAETPSHSVPYRDCSNENHEPKIGSTCGGSEQDPKPPRTVEPPTITITPPNSDTIHYDGSFKIIIHRPNLASSTKSFFVKSWFPKDTPAKLVTPRKTPRLVTRVSPSAAPKPSASIDYAIVFNQEERVRSAGGSPMKSVNGSPTRRRLELPGKISPTKRSPKKQVNPCKSPRQAEICRNLLLCSSGANSLVSRNASLIETTAHQLNPGAANQPDLAQPRTHSTSVRANTYEATGSLDVNAESAESQVKDKPSFVDLSKSTDCSGSESPSGSPLKHEIVSSQDPQLRHPTSCSNTILPHSVPSTIPYSYPPSWFPEGVPVNVVTPRRDATSQPSRSDPVPIDPSLGLKKDVAGAPINMEITVEDALSPLNKSSPVSVDPNVGSKIGVAGDPVCTLTPRKEAFFPDVAAGDPVNMITPMKDASSPLTKFGALPIVPNMDLKEVIAETSKGSAEPTVTSSSSSNVTSAKVSQIPDCTKPPTKVKACRKGKSSKVKAMGSLQFKPADSSECLTPTPPSIDIKLNDSPNVKSFTRFSKYASVITRVKPSAQINMSVAALITPVNSTPSLASRPRPVITTPSAQSTKKSIFKRSSALKPNEQQGAGNSLMNSIRSTFFQSIPISSSKADYSVAQVRTPKPRMIRRKSAPNVGVTSASEVTAKKSQHSSVVTPSQKKVNPTAESAGRDEIRSKERAKTAVQGRFRGATETSSQKDVPLLRERAESVGEVALSSKHAEPVEVEPNFPGQWKLHEVDRPTKSVSLSQRFKKLKENIALNNPLDTEPKETSNARTESSESAVQKGTSSVQKESKSDQVQPMQISTPVMNRAVERTSKEKPITKVTDGAKELNQYNAKPPSKSPVLSRSYLRKTILLDAPLKMETPTKKRKGSGDPIESPKPKEQQPVLPMSGETSGPRTPSSLKVICETKSPDESREKHTGPDRPRVGRTENVEKTSPENSNKKCAEQDRPSSGRTENVKTSSEKSSKKYAEPERPRAGRREKVEFTSPNNSGKRYAEPERPRDRRVHSLKTSLKNSFKRPAELERRRVELHRKSIHTDMRAQYFRRSRSVSSEVSSRRLRAKKLVSPKPRKKTRMHRDSPERSPARKPAPQEKRYIRSKTSSSDSDAHERSPARKSKVTKRHEKSHHKDKPSEICSSESSAMRFKATADSGAGKSEIVSSGTSDWKSRIFSPESSGKQSSFSSEITDTQSKTITSVAASNPSKIDSSESYKTISESVNDISVQGVAEVSQPETSPWTRSGKRKVKVIGAYIQTSEPRHFSEFSSSAEIRTCPPRIQQDATPTTPNPSGIIRLMRNRPTKFSNF